VTDQGSEDRGQTGKTIRGIDPKIENRERRLRYTISRSDRFPYRTRYCNDAGFIGSKEFEGEAFDQIKHLLGSKDKQKFAPVGGVEGGGVLHEEAADTNS